MHAVVCIKQVPDTTEIRVDPETGTLVRKGVPSIVNPYDMHAVEEAVRLKERHGGRVTLLSMGPPQAEAALRKAMTLGADRIVLLTDRAFAGSDTLATSYVLAAAIARISREEPVDLVLCGKQAIDGDTGQVGPGIAARLGLPPLTYVMEIESIDLEAGEVVVHRTLAGGREVVRSSLPALITVGKDINRIRYASLPNMLRALEAPLETWGKEDVEVEPERLGLRGSPTNVSKVFPPPRRSGGEVIPGGPEDPEGAARTLVEKLVSLKVLADV